MKHLIGVHKGSYIFDASEQTVRITGLDNLTLDQILLITNVNDNVVIYNFAKNTLGGSIDNNVITLAHDTTAMSDSDELQIFVEIDEPIPVINKSVDGANIDIRQIDALKINILENILEEQKKTNKLLQKIYN